VPEDLVLATVRIGFAGMRLYRHLDIYVRAKTRNVDAEPTWLVEVRLQPEQVASGHVVLCHRLRHTENTGCQSQHRNELVIEHCDHLPSKLSKFYRILQKFRINYGGGWQHIATVHDGLSERNMHNPADRIGITGNNNTDFYEFGTITHMQIIRLIAALLCFAALPVNGFAQGQNTPDLAAGEKLWKFCAFCHNADGLGQARSDAPKLAGNAAWYTERQLKYFRTKVRGYHPEDIPGLQMVVYAVPLVDDKAIRDMAAYIASMPVTPDNPRPDRMRNRPRGRPYAWDSQFAVTTAEKDADPVAGEELYTLCATCHGDNAQGMQALNAPRLDNKQDWYLVRQMKYFQYGARGTHEDDEWGRVMAEQGTLANDQEIVDVVAYIMTMSKGPLY